MVRGSCSDVCSKEEREQIFGPWFALREVLVSPVLRDRAAPPKWVQLS